MVETELGTAETRPRFFATQAEFFAWFDANHAALPEAFVGFHKKGSGLPSITWPEAVDVTLCSAGSTGRASRSTPRAT